ncbi:MAG: phosphate ABC transporter substrate-binding protein [Rhodospirillaceae bacterium]|jgi:phosphate transport system substrate-binding protein|nr:phosphate ABC transporter substrate-binding protein [Rhodospirillaceae bacterium]MBT5666703.1 phosphate ABC transporter substrate-binding protein [Rhodospirillaceae bacterium]MBT5812384.1 phosphate ABC transporter substrate-binding protein [Rhodospirillaceae bacterium]
MKKLLFVAGTVCFLAANAAQARDQIRIVGSSTVFPFSTAVAENFGRTTSFKTPVVESTGSGGGLKLFCGGVGVKHPDITNASRRIKKSEIKRCADNGVTDITEVKIGFDGIVIANSKSAPKVSLTLRHLFLALAKVVPGDEKGETLINNPYKKWSDIDGSLPNTKIEVLGPPPTSGTRDAFAELALEGGCKTFPGIKALKKKNKKHYKAVCHGVREDGAYIEAGENDVLIVNKLVANPKAFGVFGFSFLDQNADRVQGAKVNGVAPAFDDIAMGEYPVSRSMYFYVKKAHVGQIPGIQEYVAEFTQEATWGPDGYLVDKGLIPLPDSLRKKVRADAGDLAPLSM